MRRQHLTSKRADDEHRRQCQGRLPAHGEDRGSPEKVRKWFRQSFDSSDPVAVIMAHVRTMPENNYMFVELCLRMSLDHAHGSDQSHPAASQYVHHGFVPLAVQFLHRNVRDPKLRQSVYLPFSICSQDGHTNTLVRAGAVEALTAAMQAVVGEAEASLAGEMEKAALAEIAEAEAGAGTEIDRELGAARGASPTMSSPRQPGEAALTAEGEFAELCRVLCLLFQVGAIGVLNSSGEAGGSRDTDGDDDAVQARPGSPLAVKLPLPTVDTRSHAAAAAQDDAAALGSSCELALVSAVQKTVRRAVQCGLALTGVARVSAAQLLRGLSRYEF